MSGAAKAYTVRRHAARVHEDRHPCLHAGEIGEPFTGVPSDFVPDHPWRSSSSRRVEQERALREVHALDGPEIA